MTTTTSASSGSAPDTTTSSGGGFPELFDSALQLHLWMAGLLAGQSAETLRAVGLDKDQYLRELEPHREQVAGYRKLRVTNRLISRAETAELLRCRGNTMALAARTPVELAAVARTVRTLPDWVWEDVTVRDAGARNTLPRTGGNQPGTALPVSSTGSGAGFAGFTGDAPPPLNRDQRRAREPAERKLR